MSQSPCRIGLTMYIAGRAGARAKIVGWPVELGCLGWPQPYDGKIVGWPRPHCPPCFLRPCNYKFVFLNVLLCRGQIFFCDWQPDECRKRQNYQLIYWFRYRTWYCLLIIRASSHFENAIRSIYLRIRSLAYLCTRYPMFASPLFEFFKKTFLINVAYKTYWV